MSYTSTVIKIGGHLLFHNKTRVINYEYIIELINILKEIKKRRDIVVVVVGGGDIAREYMKIIKKANLNNSIQDLIGIAISRINALILTTLYYEYPPYSIPQNLDQVLNQISIHNLIFTGGFQPGQSTTGVATIIAEALNAELIIATNVDGIYDKDPRRYPNAKKYDNIRFDQLKKIFEEKSQEAGEYKLIDNLSLRILERSRMPVIVLNGNPPSNLLKAILGEKIGTKIIY